RILRHPSSTLFPYTTLFRSGDLSLLKQHYSRPKCGRESNYVIDLWEGQNLRALAQMNGLTNNHALLINCHGRRTETGNYALYPQDRKSTRLNSSHLGISYAV